MVPYTEKSADISTISNGIHYQNVFSPETGMELIRELTSDHPLYIMYPSGTTGLPECMVQSAGGIFINHMKELIRSLRIYLETTLFSTVPPAFG